ncbi:MAG: hypothetical protein C0603_03380 [Denitrovibrio sp.]|mgnify:CR=1 FL=1|nr:MAG: hypothetical protein C0603_03380 [Denitrovibrio sp.]
MSLNFLEFTEINDVSINFETDCNVKIIEVKVRDVAPIIQEIINDLLDTSWVTSLDVLNQRSLLARAKPTIEEIVTNIFSRSDDKLTSDSGEYFVSCSSQYVLECYCNHSRVILSELFGKKITGNPSFDFHTETNTSLIAFGEAKYSSSGSPYGVALSQINKFLSDEKDLQDMADIRHFVSDDANDNFIDDKKAFIASFSLNAKSHEIVFNNLIKDDNFKKLLRYNELYIIGVSIDV